MPPKIFFHSLAASGREGRAKVFEVGQEIQIGAERHKLTEGVGEAIMQVPLHNGCR